MFPEHVNGKPFQTQGPHHLEGSSTWKHCLGSLCASHSTGTATLSAIAQLASGSQMLVSSLLQFHPSLQLSAGLLPKSPLPSRNTPKQQAQPPPGGTACLETRGCTSGGCSDT